MKQADLDRVRRALARRPRPPWRVLWRLEPQAHSAGTQSGWLWRRRLRQLQVGWQLLWAERLRRDLDWIFCFTACRRGRHRDVHVMADDLVGSTVGEDYPEAAVCEVCGRVILWPKGTPFLGHPEQR